MAVSCPECDSPIDIDELDADVGDELSCSECGALLRVSDDSPLELEIVDDEDEDDLDDDDDEEEDEDDEDEDDDDEEDGGWSDDEE
ncbi:MAG: hypothetical protein AB7O67_20080 [Vicinamibacterales bacterium]